MIDFIIYYVKANGKQAPKVFKAFKKKLSPGETLHLKKIHSFKKINTRVYYAGIHSLQIQINGKKLQLSEFELKV